MDCRKILTKITEIYILLFASIHLLYFGFSGYSHIFDAKKTTFCTISLLYFIAVFIAVFVCYDREKMSIRNFLKNNVSPTRLCVIFYMLFTIISALLSDYFPKTLLGISRFEGAFTISLYCISFLLVSFFPIGKKYLLYVFAVCVTLFSVLCVIQLFSFNPLSLYPKGTNFYDAGVIYTTAFIGTTGNTNLTGAFICTAFPFLAVTMLKTKGKSRVLLLIPLSLLSYIILVMGVDSAIVGVFACVIITLPLLLDFSKKGIILYIAMLVIVVILLSTFIYFYPPESGFLKEASEILHGNIDESFGSGRIRIWKNVLSEIPDSPIFGKGPDTMKMEKFPPFERFYPARNKVMKTGIDVAHNEPLNILYHQGFAGLIFYLGFIFFTLCNWYRNRKNPLILALGASVICYFVQSLFTFSMCISAPYFWICAGLLHAHSKN